MQIILLIKGQKKTFSFSKKQQKTTAVSLTSVVILLAAFFYLFESEKISASGVMAKEYSSQRLEIERVREKTQNTLDSIALRVGQMQGQLIRLNSVGEHLAKKAKLSSPEFNFDAPPAVGGVGEQEIASSFTQGQLLQDIKSLSDQLTLREKQLELLGVFLANKTLSKEVRPAGLPVEKGWLSSFYGYRADPFTGKKAFHYGVDIAGKERTAILAAASGLVTFAGKKDGYGYLIEIDHGAGYATRYAHNKEISVKVGNLVKQGDTIAKMGSTGRSTGPHVHFEVLQHGKKVNPRKYL